MRVHAVITDEFGVMSLNELTDNYETEIDIPYMRSGKISISADGFEAGIKRMKTFLTWMHVNHRGFKLTLEQEIQEYDLIWDEVWDSLLGKDWVEADEGFLENYLSYVSVHFSRGAIYMWIDTSGLHADHMIRVTVNDAMQIACCEMI